MSTETDRDFSTDPWRSEIGDALLAAGVDSDLATVAPDGLWTATRPAGGRMAFGDDGTDAMNQHWWTSTTFDEDDEVITTESYTDLRALAQDVTAWTKAV